jgi:hypothetical protein
MANDKMRTGPRGSASQAAWFGPQRFVLQQDPGADKPGAGYITKANANDDCTIYGSAFGCDWEVVEVRLNVLATFTSPDCSFDLGVAGATACYINDGASGSATSAAGTEVVMTLNGTAPTTTFGQTNGPLLLDNTAAANAGIYSVSVLAKPVSGSPYFNDN